MWTRRVAFRNRLRTQCEEVFPNVDIPILGPPAKRPLLALVMESALHRRKYVINVNLVKKEAMGEPCRIS